MTTWRSALAAAFTVIAITHAEAAPAQSCGARSDLSNILKSIEFSRPYTAVGCLKQAFGGRNRPHKHVNFHRRREFKTIAKEIDRKKVGVVGRDARRCGPVVAGAAKNEMGEMKYAHPLREWAEPLLQGGLRARRGGTFASS